MSVQGELVIGRQQESTKVTIEYESDNFPSFAIIEINLKNYTGGILFWDISREI